MRFVNDEAPAENETFTEPGVIAAVLDFVTTQIGEGLEENFKVFVARQYNRSENEPVRVDMIRGETANYGNSDTIITLEIRVHEWDADKVNVIAVEAISALNDRQKAKEAAIAAEKAEKIAALEAELEALRKA